MFISEVVNGVILLQMSPSMNHDLMLLENHFKKILLLVFILQSYDAICIWF